MKQHDIDVSPHANIIGDMLTLSQMTLIQVTYGPRCNNFLVMKYCLVNLGPVTDWQAKRRIWAHSVSAQVCSTRYCNTGSFGVWCRERHVVNNNIFLWQLIPPTTEQSFISISIWTIVLAITKLFRCHTCIVVGITPSVWGITLYQRCWNVNYF